MNQTTEALKFGVHSMGEFVENEFMMQAYTTGKQLIVERSQWVVSGPTEFQRWLNQEFKNDRLFHVSSHIAYVIFDDILIDTFTSDTMATVDLRGTPERVAQISKRLANSGFTKAGSTVAWVHDADGNTVELPLFGRELVQSAYPNLLNPSKGINSVDDYLDRFMNSSASVMVLIGPPGTGKTSLIRHMIQRVNASAMVAYDAKVMNTDSLFANWLESKHKFLVLEDSDVFLEARANSNEMMHKFLNVSEGLVSVRGKKLIFSTNLPNVNSIDEALLRPGRCFDVPHFRELNYTEALDVVDEVNSDVELVEGKTYPLSKLFTSSDADLVPRVTRGFGFTG